MPMNMTNSITRAGHTLTWEEHSPGAHTLLFIHGYSGNRAIWSREVRRMAPLGRCVTLDLPGHYPAQAPAGYDHLSQDALIDLEVHAIRQIVGAGTATLIGHSTGGLVALAAAAALPDQVSGVVCLAGVVWGPLSGWLGRYQRWLGRRGYPLYWLNYRLTQLSLTYIQFGIGLAYSGDPRAYRRNPIAAEIVRTWHPTYRRSAIAGFAVLLQTLATCDIRPLAPRVRCPALVIAGARDPVVPVAQSRWLAANLPDVRYLELPTAGHMVHWEAAEAVERAMVGWLSH